MKTLAQHLADNGPDHCLRCNVRADGTATFYIHPMGQESGETLDFYADGNALTPLQTESGQVMTPEEALNPPAPTE